MQVEIGVVDRMKEEEQEGRQESVYAEVGEGRELLDKLWQAIVPEAVHFVRKHLKEPVTTVDNALVASCFNIMDALLRPYARYHICLDSISVQCSHVLCLIVFV